MIFFRLSFVWPGDERRQKRKKEIKKERKKERKR